MNKKNILLIILGSLLLCVLLALFINYKIKEHNKIYNLTYNVPVRVKYNQEKYNISKVKVQFTGRKIDIHLANQAAIIILDLTDYEASDEEYTVPYKMKCKVSNVECNLLEKETKVKITEK